MSTKLYINGTRADLGNTPIQETKQINDLFDVRDRKSNFTNKFNLPFTPTNKKIMDLAGVDGSSTLIPYRKTQDELVRNGIPTVFKGVGITKELTERGYSHVIMDGNIGLFDVIADKKLSDLDFSSLNHTLNAGTYTGSFTNTWSDGYIYALGDFGNLPTIIELDYQVPSLFVKWLFDKIFSEAGFTYSGDLFTTAEFESRLITPARGFSNETDPAPPVAMGSFDSDGSVQPIDSIQSFTEITPLDLVEITDPFNAISTTEFIPDTTGFYQFDYDQTFTIVNGQEVAIRIVRNGTTNIITQYGTGIGSTTFFLNAGDVVTFETIGTSVPDPTDPLFTLNYTYDVTITISRNNQAIAISFPEIVPDMTQKNFLKDIFQEYGLLFQKEKYNNNYRFKQFKDLAQEDAEDLTKKYNRKVKTSFAISGYNQENRFAYNYQDDDLAFADGILKVDDRTLDVTEKTLLTRPYLASSHTNRNINGHQVQFAPYWTPERDDNGAIVGYEIVESKSHTFNLKYVNTTISYKVSDAAGSTSFTGNLPVLEFEDQVYQEILDRNYQQYNLLLNRALVLNVEFNFTALDILDFDFLKIYSCQQLGMCFYMNKIQYKEGEPSRADIVIIRFDRK